MFIADYILFFYTDPCEVRFLGTLTSVEIRGLINDCLHSRASSTVAKYIREVRKFITFQEINSRPLLFPAKVAHMALYLTTLLRKVSKTAVLSAYVLCLEMDTRLHTRSV